MYKPDRCCLLTLLPGKQNAPFMTVRIRMAETASRQVMETLLALIFSPRTKPSCCLIEPLKAGLMGIVLIFLETTNKGNSLRPFHEKQKEKILYSTKIKAILCLNSQSLTPGEHWHMFSGHLLALFPQAAVLSLR